MAVTTAPRASFEKDWPTCNYLQQMGGKSENFTIWLNILILMSNKLSLPFANWLQVISKRGNSWSGFVPDRFHHEKRWWRRLPRTHPWFSSTSQCGPSPPVTSKISCGRLSTTNILTYFSFPDVNSWYHCCSPKCNAMFVRSVKNSERCALPKYC